MKQLLVLAIVLLMALPASAEWYVGGEVGGVFPNKVSKGDLQTASLPVGTTIHDMKLENSVMAGVRGGYWFQKQGLSWLGLASELYGAKPDISSQSIRTDLPPGFVFVSPANCAGRTSCGIQSTKSDLSIVTWAPVLIMGRYQAGPWQPYAGVGLGIFFANTNLLGPSMDTAAPGLVAKAGVEYLITNRFGVFGEWKYNYTHLDFKEGANHLAFDYSAHLVSVGLNFHFPH